MCPRSGGCPCASAFRGRTGKREANFLPQPCPAARQAENFIQEVPTMRVKITLACTECKNRNYVSKKNKKNDPDRIEMMKHCRHCNKHTLHKETK